jgi:hypothetical protein
MAFTYGLTFLHEGFEKYILPSIWNKLMLGSDEYYLTQGSYVNTFVLGFPITLIFVNSGQYFL